jgi:hypothetical protein
VGQERDAAQKAVEELVAHFEKKARAVGRASVAVGAFVGVLVGAIPLSPLGEYWPIPERFGLATLLGGLVVGVLIGFVIGDPRAKLYQQMAAQARLQLQLDEKISQNDARMAQLLTALTARAAAAAQRPAEPPVAAAPPAQPAPAPQPVPAPPVAALPQPALHPVSIPETPRLRTVPPPPTVAPAAPPLSPPVSYDTSAG